MSKSYEELEAELHYAEHELAKLKGEVVVLARWREELRVQLRKLETAVRYFMRYAGPRMAFATMRRSDEEVDKQHAEILLRVMEEK